MNHVRNRTALVVLSIAFGLLGAVATVAVWRELTPAIEGELAPKTQYPAAFDGPAKGEPGVVSATIPVK